MEDEGKRGQGHHRVVQALAVPGVINSGGHPHHYSCAPCSPQGAPSPPHRPSPLGWIADIMPIPSFSRLPLPTILHCTVYTRFALQYCLFINIRLVSSRLCAWTTCKRPIPPTLRERSVSTSGPPFRHTCPRARGVSYKLDKAWDMREPRGREGGGFGRLVGRLAGTSMATCVCVVAVGCMITQ
jgi:hypothetical protein